MLNASARARNFRGKQGVDQKEEEDQVAAWAAADKAIKPSLLSFEQDGDNPNDPKKPKGRNKAKLRLPDSLVPTPTCPSAGAAATQRSAAGEYNEDRLREMQKNTLRYVAPRAEPKEPIIMEAFEDEGEDEMPEEVIREARERRERLRVNQAADFIPLYPPHSSRQLAGGSIKNLDIMKVGSGSGSEDADDHVQLKFSEKTNGYRKLKNFDPSIHSETMVGVEEDDLQSFGSKQLGKAILRSEAAISQQFLDQGQEPEIPSSEAVRMEAENSADAAINSLQQGVERVTRAVQATQSNLDRSRESLSTCHEKIVRLKNELMDKGQRYIQVQQIRSYLSDFCDCVADKIIIIEALEQSLDDLREEMAELWSRDEGFEGQLYTQMEATVSAILLALSSGKKEDEVREAADTSASQIQSRVQSHVVDEFGRSLALEENLEVEKGKKLTKSLLSAEGRLLESLYRGEPFNMSIGWNEANKSGLAEKRREIQDTASSVFADAGEEFSSLQGLRAKLEAFKTEFPNEYSSTYFSASSAALFSPFVRLELLSWEPLTDGPGLVSRLDQQHWHQELFNYGLFNGADNDLDQDNDLVPQLVRKLVLPLALKIAEFHWNILSVEQSVRMAGLYEDTLVYCEAEEAKQMLQVLQQRIEMAVSKYGIPLWPLAITKFSKDAEIVQFRCFRLVCLLIQSLGAFEGLLPQSWLRQMALGRLVVQQCLPYLRAALGATDGNTDPYQLATARLELVASSLHDSWLIKDTSPALKPLVDHALALVSSAKRGGKFSQRLCDVARKLKISD